MLSQILMYLYVATARTASWLLRQGRLGPVDLLRKVPWIRKKNPNHIPAKDQLKLCDSR